MKAEEEEGKKNGKEEEETKRIERIIIIKQRSEMRSKIRKNKLRDIKKIYEWLN